MSGVQDKICVIGLGYVGLPLAAAFGQQRKVIGFDIDPGRIAELRRGEDRTRELGFIGRYEDEARYVELLADFIGDFPDLGDEPDHPALASDPASGYAAGQALALTLRGEGHRGLIYPSVRHPGGRCFVAFDPGIVQNVRPGASWVLTWSGAPEFSLRAL